MDMGLVDLATSISQQQTSQDVGTAVMKKAMDQVEQNGANLLKIMDSGVQPNGHTNVASATKLDAYV